MNLDIDECYIKLYKRKHFQGACLLLSGPGEYPSLRFNINDWGDQVKSLKVGPQAVVFAYEDENFEDNMIVFGPNQNVPDLDEFKFNEQIDSLKIINSIKIFDRLLSTDEEEHASGMGNTTNDSVGAQRDASQGRGKAKRRSKSRKS